MCCYHPTPRASRIIGLVILASVLLLSIPVSVSLPYLPTFDMVRVRFNTTVTLQGGNTNIQELRLGIWTACFYNSPGALTCLKPGYGYTVHMSRTVGNQTITATIPSIATTGLIIHPVSTAVIFIVFLCSLTTTHRKIMRALGWFASLLSWAAVFIAVGLVAHLGSQMYGFFDVRAIGAFGGSVGLWMSISTSILFMLSGYVARPVNRVPPVVNGAPLRIIRMDPPTPGVPAL